MGRLDNKRWRQERRIVKEQVRDTGDERMKVGMRGEGEGGSKWKNRR